MVLVCMVKNCRNAKYVTKENKCNLFRIPKDLDRSKEWLINCGRTDLCSKPVENLYNNYRVCMRHFKVNMFSNTEKTRLLITAVPTEFVMHTTITTTSNSIIDVSTMVDEQINSSVPSTSISPSTKTLDELCKSNSLAESTQTTKELTLNTMIKLELKGKKMNLVIDVPFWKNRLKHYQNK